MKALTLYQPWASLCVLPRPCSFGATCPFPQHLPHLPFKTIETRSWPAPKKLIGQRIAIHAAKRRVNEAELGDSLHPIEVALHSHGLCLVNDDSLPLGAIVGTAVLTDCVPIEACSDDRRHVCHMIGDGLLLHEPLTGARHVDTETDVSDQLPFGDFAPGWRAWLLADAIAFDEPVPARGGQGIWNWEPT